MNETPSDSFVGQIFNYLNGESALTKNPSPHRVFSSYADYNYCPSHQQNSAAEFLANIPLIFYSSSMDHDCLGLYEGTFRGKSPCMFPCLSPFHHSCYGVYGCAFEPAFIQKRNERERQRVKCMNQGYAKLRDHLPGDMRLSKVETLRAAINYIRYLQSLVEVKGQTGHTSTATTCMLGNAEESPEHKSGESTNCLVE